jgi:hypothetical protein
MQRNCASCGKYAVLRGHGHSHGRALRSVADRLLKVACAMPETESMFNFPLAAQDTN